MAKNDLLLIETRRTLLDRVNSGDQEAFMEFYDLYCPAMLEYIGYHENGDTERNELDVVQTVFMNLYKRFVAPQESEDGTVGPRANIFSVLAKIGKKSGNPEGIKFRQYLITCLKNAVRTKWRAETKGGKVAHISIDEKIDPEGEETWQALLEDEKKNPKFLDCTKAERERLAAVFNIWQSVMRGILLDESLSDCTRDVISRSLLEHAKAADLAQKWGITENNVYKIKFDGKEKALRITKAIYEMLGEDVDIEKETKRLFEAVASMKPGKHVEKFMIALAEKLFKGEDF